jgi:hypothetical protein
MSGSCEHAVAEALDAEVIVDDRDALGQEGSGADNLRCADDGRFLPWVDDDEMCFAAEVGERIPVVQPSAWSTSSGARYL